MMRTGMMRTGILRHIGLLLARRRVWLEQLLNGPRVLVQNTRRALKLHAQECARLAIHSAPEVVAEVEGVLRRRYTITIMLAPPARYGIINFSAVSVKRKVAIWYLQVQ